VGVSVPPLAAVAATYAKTITSALRQEYPNAPRHVMTDDADRPLPRQVHPSFYGCFDWHSAVEMHWALVRLLRVVPDPSFADAAHEVLAEHLTASALATEAEYFHTHPGWERPYGWGWALTLAAELADWSAATGDRQVGDLAAALEPLAEVITAGLVDWLPRLTYPERVGTHQNTAFALLRSLPHARRLAAAGAPALLETITGAARRWYAGDADYPAAWEPGGADFLSPALTEAQLIAELSPSGQFAEWLAAFLPGLAAGRPAGLLVPAVVADERDGQGAHLHGLNLYRAHAFGTLADGLDPQDPRVPILRAAAADHAAAALPAVVGAGWMAEHWLAAYAVLLLAPAG
jgi:Protein of unknown function (DUF2891)